MPISGSRVIAQFVNDSSRPLRSLDHFTLKKVFVTWPEPSDFLRLFHATKYNSIKPACAWVTPRWPRGDKMAGGALGSVFAAAEVLLWSDRTSMCRHLLCARAAQGRHVSIDPEIISLPSSKIIDVWIYNETSSKITPGLLKWKQNDLISKWVFTELFARPSGRNTISRK